MAHRFSIARQAISLLLLLVTALVSMASAAEATGPRATVAAAIAAGEGADQRKLVLSLLECPGREAADLLVQWKEGSIYLWKDAGGKVVPVVLKNDAPGARKPALRLVDRAPVLDASGQPVTLDPNTAECAETDSALRLVMKQVIGLAALGDPDRAVRMRAIRDVGFEQDPAKAPVLEKMRANESDKDVRRVLDEAIFFSLLKHPERAKRIEGCHGLGELASIASQDALRSVRQAAVAAGDKELVAEAVSAQRKIDSHVSFVNTAGTMFRGLSAGSILLVVAIGLAITFGLMGVINMAHGELIVVGAYTTYIIQNLFQGGMRLSPFGHSISMPGLGLEGAAADWYFVVALPMSFLMAALVGLLLERCVIRFLYSRPLESLLATWGVSLVLQQLFRLVFGANNVQVGSPAWLSGNWTVNDVLFGWNRVFVIAFAVAIVLSTWLVLTRTSLGLLIRAVMQNRSMAACMGVRTDRVNMMTFCFGSGLAGLRGAFLSQIGNVGPGLGQNYIVDSFMTVVVGGVGKLAGTVISALGIGVIDQSLQQILGNPVMGKILVLLAIILFLQWRPSGLFETRSRSLDQG